MKAISLIVISLFTFMLMHAQDTPDAQVAHKMAARMADSLNLTNQQRAKLFSVNMELWKKKAQSRRKNIDRQIIAKEIQDIEKSRDAMYKPLLTVEQYTLYLAKKRNLINNN